MMIDRKAKTLVAVASALLLLGACDPATNPVLGHFDDTLDAGKWRQSEAFPESDVETINVEHTVTFETGAAKLSKSALNQLDAFLEQTRRSYTTNADILVARDIRPHSLTARRVRAIAKTLTEKGLKPKLRETPAAAGAGANTITVVVQRAMVLTPDCAPAPIKYPLPTKNQAPERRLGCANTNNLAHMLADPRDLQRGRTLTPGDGEKLGLGIRRYRTDKVKEIDNESTKNQAQ